MHYGAAGVRVKQRDCIPVTWHLPPQLAKVVHSLAEAFPPPLQAQIQRKETCQMLLMHVPVSVTLSNLTWQYKVLAISPGIYGSVA